MKFPSRSWLVYNLVLILSAASVSRAIAADSDSDGMDDSYEAAEGLNVGIDDRFGDLDGDGYPNLLEYLKSTSAASSGSTPTADRVVGPSETYTTITAAVVSLTADDQLIVVKPGVYAENITNSNLRLFIISEGVDPNATVIRSVATSGATVSSIKSLYLRGFTIASQRGNYGVSLTGSGNYGLVQCVLRGHSSGIYSAPSSSSVRNYVGIMACLIQDGIDYGIYSPSNPSTFQVTHTTICGHAAGLTTGSGRGIRMSGASSSCTLTNSVIWNGGSSEIAVSGSGTTLSAAYSCIRGTSIYTGTGNINANPELSQGYLSSTSPCLDTATTTITLPQIEDLRGDPRVSGSGPDMGAHEYSTTGSWAGDLDNDGLGDLAEVYTYSTQIYSIDTDADRLDDGYEVIHGLNPLVDDRYGDMDGDGYPNLAEYLKSTLASDDTSLPIADRVVGPSETYTTIGAAITSLSADDQIIKVKAGTYIEVVNSSSRRVFIIAETADPNATTIRNPNASGGTVSSTKDLYLRGFTLASQPGNYGVNLTGSGYYGIVQCILRGHGGGIYSNPSSNLLRNNVDVIGCLILDGTNYGVYAPSNPGTFRLVHTTISGHAAGNTTSNGRGLNLGAANSVYTLTNCILSNGGTSEILQTGSGSSVLASYSNIRGATIYVGTGNINTNPQLLQGYMQSTSPCIDTGTAAVLPVVSRDVRGSARVSGSAPDIGAHEYGTGGGWGGDTDGDGLSDWDEIYTYGTKIYSADTDDDRISDGYEATHGLNGLVDDRYGDPDGDGYPNLAEYLKSSQASDNTSIPVADRIVGPLETYTTISSAVTSLSGDDLIIKVKVGTYSEAVNNTSRRVFIVAESADPNLTIIRNPSSSGSTVASTKDLYLKGFTLASQPGNTGINLTGSGYYGIVQCILRGHSTGINSNPSSSSVRNNVDVLGCLIHDGRNYGIYGATNPSTFRIVHTTICNHITPLGSGYGIYHSGGGSTYSLTNCVVWNGSSPEIYMLNGATATATYSCIRGGSVFAGTGNTNSDPQLLQGYLKSTSPCVDLGTLTTVFPISKDLRGDARTAGSNPDMGAHEYRTGGSWAGDIDGDSLTDFAEVYTHGTQIYTIDTDGDRLDDGYEVAHGLNPLIDDRYGDADGDGYPNLAEYLKSTLASDHTSIPTADRVVGPGETFFTIASAVASLSADDLIIKVKAGLYSETINNTSRRVFIIAEAADANATIIRNPNGSGGTIVSTKDLYLRGFTLIGPLGTNGINLTGSGTYGIVQCLLRGFSYGIFSAPSSSSVKNSIDVIGCSIQGSNSYGVYATTNPSIFRFIHTTIWNCGYNSVFCSANNSVGSFLNCILWSNNAAEITFSGSSSIVSVSHSCIKGATVYPGTGNINTDPQVVQGYLKSSSPCIDTATATHVPSLIKDLRGDPRISSSGPDMGAHEYNLSGSWAGDLDGDGVTDADEIYIYGSYIYSSDSDADRMNDGYETLHGHNALADDRYGDLDGDGFPNIAEYLKGTLSSDISSIPTADRVVGPAEAYTTISSALASLTADDQIILVRPGLYYEVVNNANSSDSLNRRLFLISETNNPATTFIRAAPGTAGAVRSRKDLFLGGFTVDAVMQDGITLTGGGNHAISHCILQNHKYGIHIESATSASNALDIINTLITAGRESGVQTRSSSKLRLFHSTITGHGMSHTTGSGASIRCELTAAVVETFNSILWCGGDSQIYGAAGTTTSFSHSCVRNTAVPSGPGNTNADPLLIQGQLSLGSSCVNMGGSLPFAVFKDITLRPRVSGSASDAGCYEFQRTIPTGPLTTQNLLELDLSAGTGDFDGDGLTNAEELEWGTDPLIPDTDGDGVNDETDRYPLDPSAAGSPPSGTDTTPPVFTITQPSGAVKL